MDDNRFDDLIRNKIGEYQDPNFEPAALASFHQRIAMDTRPSLYSRFRTELIAGSAVALCAVMIYFNQNQVSKMSEKQLQSQAELQAESKSQIQLLTREIENLKNAIPDTVRLVEYIELDNAGQITLLLARIDQLEKQLGFFLKSEFLNQNNLSENKPVPFGEIITPDITRAGEIHETNGTRRLDPRNPLVSEAIPYINILEKDESKPESYSAKTARTLEKHYMRGVGIKVAPVLTIDKTYFSEGSGSIHLGGGLGVDFILSPSLSVETGAVYSMHSNKIPDAYNTSLSLPDVDPQLGQLQRAEVDYYTIEIPVYLKYRYPVSDKTRIITGIGYSPYFYRREEFDYDYELASSSTASVNSLITKKGFDFYPGTLNFTFGLTSELKNKKILETRLFYQNGIGGMGIENVKMKIFGLRGAYWFTIR